MNRRYPPITLRRGTTLIEVLAGLVILSTLLVSVAIARGRFLRQWADADHRLAAVHETDKLLETWLSGPPQSVPISAQGMTDGPSPHPWRTQIAPSANAQSVGAIIVRLQLFDHSANEAPLVQVDFLLRDPRLAIRSDGGSR